MNTEETVVYDDLNQQWVTQAKTAGFPLQVPPWCVVQLQREGGPGSWLQQTECGRHLESEDSGCGGCSELEHCMTHWLGLGKKSCQVKRIG